MEIRNVYAIGRNYRDHARELDNPVPAKPLFFLKPSTAVVPTGSTIVLPGVGRVDHEVEVVVAIGDRGRRVPEERALGIVSGYAVGIDVTARDLQAEVRKQGLPWALAKGFEGFAPVGPWAAAGTVDPAALGFSLSVNGEVRQRGNTAEMLFPVARLVAYLSTIIPLVPGDLVFTGTPAGVAPLLPGDRVVAELEGGLSRLEVSVTGR